MDIEKILPRNEIKKEFTWATEDIYPSDEAFLDAIHAFKDTTAVMEQLNGKIIESSADLLKFYELYNETTRTIDAFYHYASLKSDEDTGVSKYQDYRNQASSAFVEYCSAVSYLAPQLMTLSDETLEKFYEEEPRLLFYKKHIDDQRRQAAHILDEQGEMLLAMADELTTAPENIFSIMANADLYFDSVNHNGKDYQITNGSFVPLLESPDAELREKVFKTFYKSYGNFKNTFATTLYSHMKALSFNAKARHYDSTLEAALDNTQVDPKVYHNLIDTVHKNMNYMYKYIDLRKKIMKRDELHIYDIYTPLVPDSSSKIPYDEACKNVLEAVKVLGKDYTNVLKSGFENRWIDVYENEGKRSGAYSAGCFVHPFVLLNQKDTLDSEFTLAHEMGHAMHSYLSNKTQEPIYADYVIFVAEVASTCNEALLMQYLLKKTTDKNERIALINHFLEQFRGTVYRQTMFAEFELKMNELVAEGVSLTADTLKEEYGKILKVYFGDNIILDEEILLEWSRIPHFYYNYYVYQYATGFSAAIALSNKILTEGQPAVDKYLNFLSMGRTKDPVSLLKDAGVDMASPKPIEDALKLFGELIDEMEELTK